MKNENNELINYVKQWIDIAEEDLTLKSVKLAEKVRLSIRNKLSEEKLKLK